MGLFMDPEEMMDMQGNVDDTELEAEFAALVGRKSAAEGAAKPKAKGERSLLPRMVHLAPFCFTGVVVIWAVVLKIFSLNYCTS